jgi:hypothetical protein
LGKGIQIFSPFLFSPIIIFDPGSQNCPTEFVYLHTRLTFDVQVTSILVIVRGIVVGYFNGKKKFV